MFSDSLKDLVSCALVKIFIKFKKEDIITIQKKELGLVVSSLAMGFFIYEKRKRKRKDLGIAAYRLNEHYKKFLALSEKQQTKEIFLDPSKTAKLYYPFTPAGQRALERASQKYRKKLTKNKK